MSVNSPKKIGLSYSEHAGHEKMQWKIFFSFSLANIMVLVNFRVFQIAVRVGGGEGGGGNFQFQTFQR